MAIAPKFRELMDEAIAAEFDQLANEENEETLVEFVRIANKLSNEIKTCVDSYVLNIAENLERSSDIVDSNKLIEAQPLSQHFGDPIAELNKLIGGLK